MLAPITTLVLTALAVLLVVHTARRSESAARTLGAIDQAALVEARDGLDAATATLRDAVQARPPR